MNNVIKADTVKNQFLDGFLHPYKANKELIIPISSFVSPTSLCCTALLYRHVTSPFLHIVKKTKQQNVY